MPLLLPFLFVMGALAAFAGSGSGTPSPAIPSIPEPVVSGRRRTWGRPPAPRGSSAIAILLEYARHRRPPPPPVIEAALAEAQRSGHAELVRAIVDTYVRPVVEAAEAAEAAERARLAAPGWGAPGYPPGGYPAPSVPSAPPPSAYGYPPAPAPAYGPGVDPGYAYPPGPPSMGPLAPLGQPGPSGSTDDPASQAQAQDPSVPPSGPPAGAYAAGVPAWMPGGPAPMIPLGAHATDDDILRLVSHLATPPSGASPSGAFVGPGAPGFSAGGVPMGGPPTTGPDTVTVSGRSSPIEGVGNGDWARFCERMSRELPTYTSAHHVGQFRQRRGRLLELGLDPQTVLAYPEGQRDAFDVDMSDAYGRAAASGLLGHVGQIVEVPTQDGPPAHAQVTTSGVLSVVQAAGIEGAAGWLRSLDDRRRFRGTTAVFCAANGVF